MRESLEMDSHHAGGPTNPSNAVHLIAFASSRWRHWPSAAAVVIICSGPLCFVSTSAGNKQPELLMRGTRQCITARQALRWRWGLVMGGERRLAEAGINDGRDSLKNEEGQGMKCYPVQNKALGPRCTLQGLNLCWEGPGRSRVCSHCCTHTSFHTHYYTHRTAFYCSAIPMKNRHH